MTIQKTEAIVLRTQPFRTSSLIVTLYTRSFGKLKGVAKGVRLDRELRGSLYELFTKLDLVYYEKTRSDLHLLSEASMIDSYEPLRSRLESICYAGYLSELVDELFEFHDPHEKIFLLLDQSFKYLPSLPGPRVARPFEIKLLHEIGWMPFLESCLQCGQKEFERGFFSAKQGALFCAQCAVSHPDAKPLEAEPLSAMRYFLRHDFEAALRFPLSRHSEQSLEKLIDGFFSERLFHPLKSRKFLDQVRHSFS